MAVRTIRRELAGASPILRPPAIRRENCSDGLNILTLHYAEPRLPEDVRMASRYRMHDAFIENTRGYRIKTILQELWDEMPPQYIVSGWGKVLTDYAAYFERRGQSPPPPGRRPFLIGLTRQDILASPGNIAAAVFICTPPRLGFTRAEQRMLRQAVLGCTDVELARRLNLAQPTIKSHWRTLYDRLGRIAPELIPEVDSPDNQIVRGQEKRRRVIDYMRRHPEELRPGLWRTR